MRNKQLIKKVKSAVMIYIYIYIKNQCQHSKPFNIIQNLENKQLLKMYINTHISEISNLFDIKKDVNI